jgi:hypothetical protein
VDNGLDYELSPPTAHILRLWNEGHDQTERGVETPPQISECLAYMGTLTDFERGLVLIDVLTLLEAMKQAVLMMQTDPMDPDPQN